MSHEQEGVIKFTLDFEQKPLTAHSAYSKNILEQLNQWRLIAYKLDLIGQDPERYMGYGFGNISCRLQNIDTSFLISGTQTGEKLWLSETECAIVENCNPIKNYISATGQCKPSSEAMTHGQLYLIDKNVNAVIHVHSPDIWNNRDKLVIPSTGADVPYGTPLMAKEVERLFKTTDVSSKKIFAMAGHDDGVVVFDKTLEGATATLTHYYANAALLQYGSTKL